MRLFSLSTAIFGALVCVPAPALAWSDSLHGRSNAAAMPPIHAYPARENHCPDGLQPVVVGGVVCCGSPTHYGYESNAHPRPRGSRARRIGVAYGKGYNEIYPVAD